jgi:hypothetical protein
MSRIPKSIFARDLKYLKEQKRQLESSLGIIRSLAQLDGAIEYIEAVLKSHGMDTGPTNSSPTGDSVTSGGRSNKVVDNTD